MLLKTGRKAGGSGELSVEGASALGAVPIAGRERQTGVFDPSGNWYAEKWHPVSSEIVTAFSHWTRVGIVDYSGHSTCQGPFY